jgi:hypothetical protein
MTTTTKTQKVIGLWLDETSGTGRAWIVSRDDMNTRGEAEYSQTIEWRNVDDHEDAYEQAREVALEVARKEGLCVIETEGGAQATVYAPKRIVIADVGTTVVYRLYGSTLEMAENGGCEDGLNDGGCAVSDEMDDDEITGAVTECWVAGCSTNMGGEYDPDANGLRVTVESEESVIGR